MTSCRIPASREARAAALLVPRVCTFDSVDPEHQGRRHFVQEEC